MVRIDPERFRQAADDFDGVTSQSLNYAIAARGALSRFSGIAGTDSGGEAFAQGYDAAAGDTLQLLFNVAVTARGLDRALMASGATHAQANANAEGIVYDAAGDFVLRPAIEPTAVVPPPSAFGGKPDFSVIHDPVQRFIVEQLVNLHGVLFPNADTEALDEAASAWRIVVRDVRSARLAVVRAKGSLSGIESGEVALVTAKIDELAEDIRDFLDDEEYGISGIAGACEDYAQEVRDTHRETWTMIAQLAIEIAVSAGLSVALSFFTFGAAGVAGAGLIAGRIAIVAGRIITIMQKCASRGGMLATRLLRIQDKMNSVNRKWQLAARVSIQLFSGTTGAVVAETVRGENANYWAAAAGGFIGSGVTAGIVTPFGRRGESFFVQALGNGVGGVAGSATDTLLRGEEITAGGLAFAAGLGVVMSARLPGRRPPGSGSGTNPGGGGPRVEVNAPAAVGGSGTASSGVDAAAPRAQFDGPTGQGGNAVGSGGDGGGAPRNHGDAPTNPEINVTPGSGTARPDGSGADATPGGQSGGDAPPPRAPGGDGTPVSGDGAPVRTPGGEGSTPVPRDTDGPAPRDGDGPPPRDPDGSTSRESDGPPPPRNPDGDGPASRDSDAPPRDADGPAPRDGDGPPPRDPDGDGPTARDSDAPPRDADGPTSRGDDAPPVRDADADAAPRDVDGDAPRDTDPDAPRDADGDAARDPDGDSARGDGEDVPVAYTPADSPNPRVQSLFDADGKPLSFKDWDAQFGDKGQSLNTRKGEYGELHSQHWMESQGWERIDTGAAGGGNPNQNGVDGIYQRTGPDGKTEYAIIEAKYNTAGMGNTQDGRQMSHDWILGTESGRNRVLDALGGDVRLMNQLRLGLGEGGPRLGTGLVRVHQDGSVTIRELDSSGYVSGDHGRFDALVE